jgi:beta-lactamase superfamily II metal-dependent hydrolase
MTEKMGYEIDFLPVGENSKNGDAIAVRYGYPGVYKVMVIDGGTKDSGEKLVHHIQTYYGTSFVDYVVNTHPDKDHASGLSVVLEKLEVGELWMHLPWEHSTTIRDLYKDGRITDNSLSERIKENLNAAHAIYEIATEKKIKIKEPFEGEKIGEFTVLSPNKEWYLNELLPKFPGMPETKANEVYELLKSLQEATRSAVKKVVNYIKETWSEETLKEDVSTSERNESSVILHTILDNTGILLTGDAGVRALNKAADYAETIGVDLKNCKFIQVPHHGSRHNVSPSVLDKIVGPRLKEGTPATKRAYVSTSKGAEDYPRRSVSNAFARRGANVYATNGLTIRHHSNMPARKGWTRIEPLPLYDEVEE